MRKTFIIILLIFFTFLGGIFIIYHEKNSFTNDIKNIVPKDFKGIAKKVIRVVLNNFDTNFKLIETTTRKSEQNKEYLIREFNNPILNFQGPRAYLSLLNNNLYLLTGTGTVLYTDINNIFERKKLSFSPIKSNLNELIAYDKFFTDSSYGTKGIKVIKNKIYISFSNEISKDCFQTSIVSANLNFKKLKFSYLFKPKQCIARKNDYGEFQPIQSGGAMFDFNNEYLIFTNGEFRYRTLAQENDSIFGKILLINKINGDYKIISKGHRNSQGIFFQKEKNIILSTDHGPYGGDEVNIQKNINEIENFGWPISSYGEHYKGMTPKEAYIKAPLHKSHKEYGFKEPIKYYVPSIGITQIINVPNEFNNLGESQFFVASMGFGNEKSESIHHLILDSKYENITFEDQLKIGSRIRDIIYYKNKNVFIAYLEKKGSLLVISN